MAAAARICPGCPGRHKFHGLAMGIPIHDLTIQNDPKWMISPSNHELTIQTWGISCFTLGKKKHQNWKLMMILPSKMDDFTIKMCVLPI
jgi:hypothetical protein